MSDGAKWDSVQPDPMIGTGAEEVDEETWAERDLAHEFIEDNGDIAEVLTFLFHRDELEPWANMDHIPDPQHDKKCCPHPVQDPDERL